MAASSGNSSSRGSGRPRRAEHAINLQVTKLTVQDGKIVVLSEGPRAPNGENHLPEAIAQSLKSIDHSLRLLERTAGLPRGKSDPLAS